MNKIVYFECFIGIVGDMCLGVLVYFGVFLKYLIEKLNFLGIFQEYQLSVEKVYCNGLLVIKFYVKLINVNFEDGEFLIFDRYYNYYYIYNLENDFSIEKYYYIYNCYLLEIELLIKKVGLF